MIALLVADAWLLGRAFQPGPWGWLMWVALAPYMLVVRKCSGPRRAFRLGWFLGTCAWAFGMPWLIDVAATFLGGSRVIGVAAFVGVCVWHGLAFGVCAAALQVLEAPLGRRLGTEFAFLLLAVCLGVLMDGYFPLLFPIHFIDSQSFRPVAVQSAELCGPAGMAALLVFFNAALCWALTGGARRWRPLAWALLLALANEGYGRWRLKQVDSELARLKSEGRLLRVAALQAALSVRDKLTPSRFETNLKVHRELGLQAARAGAGLIIWPETMYRRLLAYDRDRGTASASLDGEPFSARLRRDLPVGVPMVLGAVAQAPSRNGPGKAFFNTAFLVDGQGSLLSVIEKRHLMPFGEFMPLGRLWPALYRLSPYAVSYERGSGQAVLQGVGVPRLGVMICYEDVWDEYVRRQVVSGAQILVNMTDTTLFGLGVVPEQHLRLSLLRAVENRRFLVRAVNSGISAVVDPGGRVVTRLGPGSRGVLIADIAALERRTLFSVLGPWPYRGAAALLFALGFWAWGGRRR